MAPLRYAAKFDSFPSLDCARAERGGPSGNTGSYLCLPAPGRRLPRRRRARRDGSSARRGGEEVVDGGAALLHEGRHGEGRRGRRRQNSDAKVPNLVLKAKNSALAGHVPSRCIESVQVLS